MAWLPDGEKISKISFFVLVQLTNVTDGRTDRRTPHAAYASHRRGKRKYSKNQYIWPSAEAIGGCHHLLNIIDSFFHGKHLPR